MEHETWMAYIIRATRIAEASMQKAKVSDWILEQRKRKWRWSGRIARRTDGRWGTRMLSWIPAGGRRSVGHPAARWVDAIDKFTRERTGMELGSWRTLVWDRAGWESWADDFAAAGI